MFERTRVGLSSLVTASLLFTCVAPAFAQQQPTAAPSSAEVQVSSSPSSATPRLVRAEGEQGERVAKLPVWPPPEGPVVEFSPKNPDAVLERWEYSEAEGKSEWRTVCTGACSRPMDTRYGYRVTGSGVVTSPWFMLPAAKEQQVKLSADTGSSAKRTTGIVFSVLGVAASAVGLTLMLERNESETGGENNRRDPFSGQGLTGGIITGAGVAVFLTGLVLIGASSTSLSAEGMPSPQQAKLKLSDGVQLTPGGLRFLSRLRAALSAIARGHERVLLVCVGAAVVDPPIVPDLHVSSVQIFSIGELVSGVFEVRSVLGSGGMGQVFEAHDRVLNRRVALKVAWPDLNEPIRKEAQALAAIRHPSMITVYAVGQHRGLEYIVMERVYGITMDAHLSRRREHGEPLSAQEVIDLLAAIAGGLVAVHAAGITHRDIKPANIMLAPGNRVVLMDFGLFLPEPEMAGQLTVAGSPQYMAPEAITNEVMPGAGHLVDLYALGILGFEMLTGEVPFSGEEITEVWDKHMSAPIPDVCARRPDVPRALGRLLRELLAKDPRDRLQSAEAVLWQLERIQGEGLQQDVFSVLIVDDDPQLQRVLGFYVRKFAPDAEVRVVSDGDGAIEAVRQRAPHLMLLDLHMPRMNGVEVCMYLRGTGIAERTTIVAVSAGAQEHDVQLLQQMGITRFIPKGPELGKKIGEVTQEIASSVRGHI